MKAHVSRRSLGIEFFRVDLVGVMNKYMGETEKRLKQILDWCERTIMLLLFDEADALSAAANRCEMRTTASATRDRLARYSGRSTAKRSSLRRGDSQGA